jgi:predicted lipid-binding transport protein (Tim44 family)
MNSTTVKSIFLMILTVFIFFAQHVEAKRMGGGASLGRQSAPIAKNPSALPPKPSAAPTNPASRPGTNPAAAPSPSRFGGMGGILGGIAAGIGLSYLFSSMGMGAGMAGMFSNILLIGLLVFVGIWLFRRFAGNQVASQLRTPPSDMAFSMPNSAPMQNTPQASPTPAPSFGGINNPAAKLSNQNQLPLIPEVTSSTLNAPIIANLSPGSFADKDQFLENAKTLFLQLQEASDQQNIEVLREYTTPELFTLLRKDMLSRTSAISFTQVLTLAADLVAVEEENQEYLASVRFSGSIREEVNGPVEDFQEVWNWSKPFSGSTGWILCGIQQIN